MAKNNYIGVVKQAKDKAYSDGVWDGMRMGFNIVAIALNHEFSFGDTRLKKLETKVQALVDEIVDTRDPLVNRVHIEQALKQIRGDKWEE